MSSERVLCAAVYLDNGLPSPHLPWNLTTGIVVGGWRHHNCLATLYSLTDRKAHEHGVPLQQGFLTSNGRYLNRTKAYRLAQRAGQMPATPPPDASVPFTIPELYSEDIY